MSSSQSFPASPVPPFRYAGGNLGIADEGRPWIYFMDANDQKWLTHSVEEVLRRVPDFTGNEHGDTQLLAAAAIHYGLSVNALIDGYDAKARAASPAKAVTDQEPLYDLIDDAGRLMLAGVSQRAARVAYDSLRLIPGWDIDLRICRQHPSRSPCGMLWDWRHEGPLKLLAHSSNVECGVLVRSHVGRCGMALEEAARRLDQFTPQHQAVLMAEMAESFGFDTAVQEMEVA
jgi:hypothetical protein